MKRRMNWRVILARLPLPMLALAASWGVFSFARLFVPVTIAIIQAAAFELTYIGLAITRDLRTADRRRATAISLGAVVTSIIYNTLAGWFERAPQLLAGADQWLWLVFAVLHGAPLALVAYLVADLLLHTAPRSNRAAQLRATVKQLARGWRADRLEVARLVTELASWRASFEASAQDGTKLAAEAAQLRRKLAQMEADAAQPIAIDGIDLLAVARKLRAAGVPSRETADLLRVPESTLRARLDKASTNGHAAH